jgi:hypothetical protein
MRKDIQGLYDNQDIIRIMIKDEFKSIRKLIENRTDEIFDEISEMKKKLFTTHQQAAYHNKEVERLIEK